MYAHARVITLSGAHPGPVTRSHRARDEEIVHTRHQESVVATVVVSITTNAGLKGGVKSSLSYSIKNKRKLKIMTKFMYVHTSFMHHMYSTRYTQL